MGLSYGGQRRGRVYQYRCSCARAQHGGPDCQIIGGKRIDQTVVEVLPTNVVTCHITKACSRTRLSCAADARRVCISKVF